MENWMTVHQLADYRERPSRPDLELLFKDEEWEVSKFYVAGTAHYRLHRRQSDDDEKLVQHVSSVYKFNESSSALSVVGFCQITVTDPRKFDERVEKMRHLQKVLEVMAAPNVKKS